MPKHASHEYPVSHKQWNKLAGGSQKFNLLLMAHERLHKVHPKSLHSRHSLSKGTAA